MPLFRTQRPRGIADSMRTLLGSSAEPSAAERIQVDRFAADAARNESLAEKTREELRQMREADRRRNDPRERSRYAGTTSGLNLPDAEALHAFIEGNEGATRPENVTPEQERLFRTAIGQLMATGAATGNTNAQQMTAAGGNLLSSAVRNEMTAPGTSVERANALGHSQGIRSREPFRVTPHGAVLNEETGGINEGTGIATATRANIAAQETERRAQAGLHSTRAGDITATQPARIDRDKAAAEASRRGPQARPAPQRTPAQEARDKAYADRARAQAATAQGENDRRSQTEIRGRFRADPAMKGNKPGKWVPGQGFEVLDKSGKHIGYYD
jgi:hypothetical protein